MKKKRNLKMTIKILGIILSVFIVFGIVGTIANKHNIKTMIEYISSIESVVSEDKIDVSKDEEGFYTITTDRDLKIVQITDIHLGGGWMSKKDDMRTIKTVATMILEEKPDLVFATGDISFPVPFLAGTFNNLYAAEMFATLMETLNVYWIPTLGNHDAESYSIYNRGKVGDFYSYDERKNSLLMKNCLFQKGDENIDGVGNSIIKVKNSDGIITQALFTIDSNAYPKGSFLGLTGGYDNIHENQIEWYKTSCERLNAENKAFIEKSFDGDKKTQLLNDFGLVKSLVFMHIPPIEYADAWGEFKNNGYKNTENVKYYYGTLGEEVCCPAEDDLFFETAIEMKSTQGIFVGHDHINTFSMDYKGIRLTYGMSIDYIAYGKIDKLGTQRGCTIITLRPDGTFDCYPENYYQDKYENPNKEKVTMQQLNEYFN